MGAKCQRSQIQAQAPQGLAWTSAPPMCGALELVVNVAKTLGHWGLEA